MDLNDNFDLNQLKSCQVLLRQEDRLNVNDLRVKYKINFEDEVKRWFHQPKIDHKIRCNLCYRIEHPEEYEEDWGDQESNETPTKNRRKKYRYTKYASRKYISPSKKTMKKTATKLPQNSLPKSFSRASKASCSHASSSFQTSSLPKASSRASCTLSKSPSELQNLLNEPPTDSSDQRFDRDSWPSDGTVIIDLNKCISDKRCNNESLVQNVNKDKGKGKGKMPKEKISLTKSKTSKSLSAFSEPTSCIQARSSEKRSCSLDDEIFQLANGTLRYCQHDQCQLDEITAEFYELEKSGLDEFECNLPPSVIEVFERVLQLEKEEQEEIESKDRQRNVANEGDQNADDLLLLSNDEVNEMIGDLFSGQI